MRVPPFTAMLQIALVFAALACARQADADTDVMRCGGALISVGMVAPQVVAKCGQPEHKQIENVPIRARSPNGLGGKVGVTQIERWTYDLGYGRFKRLLTFEEGKLKSIELLTQR